MSSNNGMCENCKKKPWTETMNHMGDFYHYCKKCYIKIKYPIKIR